MKKRSLLRPGITMRGAPATRSGRSPPGWRGRRGGGGEGQQRRRTATS